MHGEQGVYAIGAAEGVGNDNGVIPGISGLRVENCQRGVCGTGEVHALKEPLVTNHGCSGGGDIKSGRITLNDVLTQGLRDNDRGSAKPERGDGTRDRTEGVANNDTVAADVICLRSEEHTSELQSLAYLVCRL